MEITEERRADILILGIIGRLDASTSKDAEDKILALLASSQGKVVIDLSELNYVSSAGLRIFIRAAKHIDEANGKMIFCSLQNSVKEIFDIVGFSSLLTLADSTEEAIRNL